MFNKQKGFALALALGQGILILPLLFWLLRQPTAVHALDWNVNTFTDASDGSCGDGTCSLRDAILLAASTDTIYLPAGNYILSSALGEINIAKTLTLIGQGATPADTTIDGDHAIRLFNISAGTVTFSNLTLQNGQPASGNGGAILTSGTGSITLDNSIISNNATLGNGGGIYLAGGTLNILNGSQVVSNTAVSNTVGSGNGGGIYSNNGPVNLTDSTIASNTAQLGGGLTLNLASAQLTINNGQFLNNEALLVNSFTGGAINIGFGSAIMHSGLISGNTAFRGAGAVINSGSFTLNGGTVTDNESDYGAAFYVRNPSALLTVNGGTISSNRSVAAIFGGGALYIFQGQAVQNGGEINGNTAVNLGGAMEVRQGGFTMNGGTISGNSAGNWGGAIYNDIGTITITNGTLANNYSALGGGAIATGADSHNLIRQSVLYTNTSPAQTGGAILNTGTLTLTNVTLSDNLANVGGALQNEGTATLTNVTVFENTAVSNGGGLNENGGTLNVVNSIVAGNSAPTGPDCAGTIISQGYNLIQDSTDCTVSGSTTGNVGGDPLLAALALNGGSTLNHEIGSSSPALDAGDNATCASIDQRGVSRPLDGNEDTTATCDIGAFERGASLTIDDVTITEGNSGSKTASFTVTLAPASPAPVTVNYATADGTAVLSDSDYVNKSGQLTFVPGDTEEIIEITINGDGKDEWDETFLVNLSGASEATISDAQAIGTISNDDTAPTFSIADTSVTEGNGNTTAATFTVTLSAVSGKTVEVDFATGDDTAVAPTDYTADSNTLTFNPGDTEKIINISVNGDLTDEDAESFVVTLNNASNATIADGEATGSITDDDAPPHIRINDIMVTEGNSGTSNATFTVTLDQASSKIITVDYETLADSATAGTDYTIASGTLTFDPGNTQKTITVLATGDPIDEDNEIFFVMLNNAANAALADDQGQATITDDDAPPALSITDVTVNEGDSGTSTAVFTVTLSQASSKIITVDVNSGDGTATAGDDYTAVATTLIFNPGESLSQTVNVTIHGDTTTESSETFLLILSSASNATLGSSQATGTITDDDGVYIFLPFVVKP